MQSAVSFWFHRGLALLLVLGGGTLAYMLMPSCADILTCDRNAGGTEFCYFPRVVVTGVHSPWYFGLHPDVTLSEASQELVDEFLAAHEVCWDSGD